MGAGKDNPQLLFQTHSVNKGWMGEEGHGQKIREVSAQGTKVM